MPAYATCGNSTYALATFVTGVQPTISGRAIFGRIIPEEKGSPFGRGFGDSFRDRAHNCMLKSAVDARCRFRSGHNIAAKRRQQ